MTIKVGDKLPEVTIKMITDEGAQDVSLTDIFAHKKAILFAVPGAFTPTCSEKHLPGFVEKAQQIKEKGVDTIACISVNDAFVMKAWSKHQKAAQDIMMLADGNADFTKAIGLTMDASAFGMGLRSQRYAMIINNGVVEALFVEEPKQFEKTSAEAILAVL